MPAQQTTAYIQDVNMFGRYRELFATLSARIDDSLKTISDDVKCFLESDIEKYEADCEFFNRTSNPSLENVEEAERAKTRAGELLDKLEDSQESVNGNGSNGVNGVNGANGC